jgi:hypothetical protein
MKNNFHGVASFILCLGCLLLITSMSGCVNVPEQGKRASQQEIVPKALGNAELYTYELAQELFANMTTDRQYRYAVVGFVPAASMQQDINQQGPLMLLSHQLEQGLTTEAVRRGFIAQDYKATNTIIMSDNSERALSRNVEHLRAMQAIDYYITGTIVEQEKGAIVNARIINVRNKDVIAAATKFFPSELFWQKEQVSLRNGMLYRTTEPLKHTFNSGE